LSATQMVSGGGWDDNVPCTCAHVECYAAGPCVISPKQPDWSMIRSGSIFTVGHGDKMSARTCGPTCKKCLLSEKKGARRRSLNFWSAPLTRPPPVVYGPTLTYTKSFAVSMDRSYHVASRCDTWGSLSIGTRHGLFWYVDWCCVHSFLCWILSAQGLHVRQISRKMAWDGLGIESKEAG